MFSKKRIFIVIPMIWLGFVLSISFMETWLKFQAEGVTQPIGLSIGKLVFGALNKVELFLLACLIISALLYLEKKEDKRIKMILMGITLLVLVQTFYLLPFLDRRIDQILSGIQPAPSYVHFYYVSLEVIKVVGLVILSHRSLKKVNV